MKNLAFFFAFVLTSVALYSQSFDLIGLSKNVQYRQVSEAVVELSERPWDEFDSGVYSFSASVQGENISGIAAPVLSGPITVQSAEGFPDATFFNGGQLVFDAEEGSWRFGFPNADDWSVETKSQLDAAFGISSPYNLTVQGTTFELTLAPESYPNTPEFALSGGEWIRGKYYIASDASLTVSTNTFLAFGDNFEDVIVFGLDALDDEPIIFASSDPTADSYSTIIAPGTMEAGRSYEMRCSFIALTDGDNSDSFPDAIIFAGYEVSTEVEIVVTPLPSPVVVPTEILSVNGGIDVRFEIQSGTDYTLQGSNDLEVWYDVINNIQGYDGEFSFFTNLETAFRYYQGVRYIPEN